MNRIRTGDGQEFIAGGSAFNSKAESLRLGGSAVTEVFLHLRQCTAETGQAFTANGLELLW